MLILKKRIYFGRCFKAKFFHSLSWIFRFVLNCNVNSLHILSHLLLQNDYLFGSKALLTQSLCELIYQLFWILKTSGTQTNEWLYSALKGRNSLSISKLLLSFLQNITTCIQILFKWMVEEQNEESAIPWAMRAKTTFRPTVLCSISI